MSEQNPVPEQSKKHPYQTIGGWLWLWVASSFLALPINILNLLLKIKRANDYVDFFNSTIAPYVDAIDTPAGYAPALLDFLPIITGLIAIYVSIQIILCKPRFLLFHQMSCLVNIALYYVAVVADGIYAGLVDEKGTLFALLFIILMAIIDAVGFFLSTLYSVRSVRVRTYMGSDEYLKLAFFTKKMKGPEPAVPDAEEPANIVDERGLT